MQPQRGAVLFIIAGAAAAVVLVIVVVIVIRLDPPADRPSVRYLSVDAQPAPAHVRGHELAVSIELEVTSRMPHVAPHVVVAARCGTSTDDTKAFFMDLSNAEPGDRKVATVRLFEVRTLGAPPDRCELVLSLSEGATPPQRFCHQGGRTAPGPCP